VEATKHLHTGRRKEEGGQDAWKVRMTDDGLEFTFDQRIRKETMNVSYVQLIG
jgi:hypothetical protein